MFTSVCCYALLLLEYSMLINYVNKLHTGLLKFKYSNLHSFYITLLQMLHWKNMLFYVLHIYDNATLIVIYQNIIW